MTLLKSTFHNAFKNILRNKLISFLSLGIIAFTLLITGIFHYLTHNIDLFVGNFSKNIEAIFYLRDGTGREEIDMLIKNLEGNLLVESVTFKSSRQAEVSFGQQFPELEYIISEFKESPFPSSIGVRFKSDQELNVKTIALIDDIEKLDIVESKQVNLDWAKKVLSVKQFVSVVGLFLSFILIFVSCFIIFNVIKINIFYRKEEIAIYRLVGAQDWYIRFPFIIEGALLGFMGSLVAAAILFAALKLFPLYASFMYNIVKGMIDFKEIPLPIFIRLLILGTAIGLLSSYFSLKQFIKR